MESSLQDIACSSADYDFDGICIGGLVDTGRALGVHKAFRGRPGRLLGVLCTFGLCPVSTGN